MAKRSRWQGWILLERANPTPGGPPLTPSAGALLLCLMKHLLTIDRSEMPGEELTDETSEVLALSRAESVPEGWDQLGRAWPACGRGGIVRDVRPRMRDLLEFGRDDGTTGPVPAVPRQRLSPSSLRRDSTLCEVQCDGVLEDVQYLAGHADPRTTRIYDRRRRKVTRNIVERISI
jgi:hypothetical protein